MRAKQGLPKFTDKVLAVCRCPNCENKTKSLVIKRQKSRDYLVGRCHFCGLTYLREKAVVFALHQDRTPHLNNMSRQELDGYLARYPKPDDCAAVYFSADILAPVKE